MDLLKRQNYASGAPFEDKAGYSRAVKVGNMVFVGGTTSTNSKGEVEGVGNAYLQTKIIFQKIEDVLKRAGARMSDVARVRFYVTDIGRGQEYLRAYSEWFKDIRPVITMAEVKALARPDHLVEIEVDAVVGSYRTSG
ncbi:MAG: RidA family protein [Deltaproteobacteria bacterium]|jgi:enamine deaminase RidA (YjgF/YER057c/UK114 family)|nr:MAG: RidA family protein [Deltaproteobacteria bacterium]